MKYIEYLKKYQELGQRDWDSFESILEEINKVKLNRSDNPTSNAIIVLGYSGNGKTTSINKFISKHPEYKAISIDEIGKEFIDKYKKFPNLYEIQSLFGEVLEKLVKNNESIILDGNFLNILNRMALIDYLHGNNYNVNSLNLTPIISETLPKRIEDETSKLLKKYFNGDNNFYDYANNIANQRVLMYYQQERKKAAMIEQELYKSLSVGVDKEFYIDDIEELKEKNKKLEKK